MFYGFNGYGIPNTRRSIKITISHLGHCNSSFDFCRLPAATVVFFAYQGQMVGI